MSCCQTMLMDNRKQGEREIAPEMRGRAFPAKHLALRVKAEQNKGRLKKEFHRGRGYQCGGTWVPVGKVNILVPHLLPKLLATRKMLMVPGSSLVPSSIPRCPGSALLQPQLQGEPLCSWGIVAFCLLQHLVGK